MFYLITKQHMHIVLFSMMFLFSSLTATKQDTYITDRLDWQKTIKNHTTITIENLHGNVHIKKSNNSTFLAHAVAQNHNSRSQRAKILTNHDENHIDLKLVFTGDVIENERIDLSILVPKNVDVSIVMKGNELHGKKINFPLKVSSESTDIQISTSNAFDLFSKTGDISVKLKDKLAKQSSSVKTHKSNIVIDYGKTVPYFDVISGLDVVSNSSELISSKKQQRRHKLFNDPQSHAKISVVSDVGRVILLQ